MAAANQRRQTAPRPPRRWGWRIFFAVLLLVVAGLGGLGGWAWWQHGLKHPPPAGQHEQTMTPGTPAAEPPADQGGPPEEGKPASGEPAGEISREVTPKPAGEAAGQAEPAREDASGAAEKKLPSVDETVEKPSSPDHGAANEGAVREEKEAVATGERGEGAPLSGHEAATPAPAPAAQEPSGEQAPARTADAPEGSAAQAGPSAHEGEPEADAAAKPGKERQAEGHEAPSEAAPAQEVAVLPPPPLPEKEAPARPDALKPAPDPDLVQESDKGLLPVISPDGRQPWRVYARPFRRRGNEPLIAIVIGDMGLSAAATEAVTQQLPGEVTMAFAPYGGELARQIPAARAAGHEVLLQLPMEPFNYPTNDPGPFALLTSLGTTANIDRLEWLLGRFTGYVGVTTYMGEKFTVSPKDMRPVINVLRRRGLMLVDARRNAASIAAVLARDLGVPQAYSNLTIDRHASRIAIDTSLRELERIALRDGAAVGFASAYPVTIDRIANWAPSLELKGIRLAPITAVANQQPLDQ